MNSENLGAISKKNIPKEETDIVLRQSISEKIFSLNNDIRLDFFVSYCVSEVK